MFSMDIYVSIRLALTFVSALIWFIAGGLLFWRKSNDWFALIVALALVLVGTSMTLNTVVGSNSV